MGVKQGRWEVDDDTKVPWHHHAALIAPRLARCLFGGRIFFLLVRIMGILPSFGEFEKYSLGTNIDHNPDKIFKFLLHFEFTFI